MIRNKQPLAAKNALLGFIGQNHHTCTHKKRVFSCDRKHPFFKLFVLQ
ncbi:hypothetical protein M23134_02470 [Microscilla marina ATCC 23134]|uniref:Uncharacterized protein n=1 Tax=Microscilla marina ATCC 23134 TaxID=313606 RepID=A1ZZT3_MICM2|nr:hypothetical protein M23134_02470 [Microscilla marina ATCC 23134]